MEGPELCLLRHRSISDLNQSPGSIMLCCAVPPSPLMCCGGVLVAEGHVPAFFFSGSYVQALQHHE